MGTLLRSGQTALALVSAGVLAVPPGAGTRPRGCFILITTPGKTAAPGQGGGPLAPGLAGTLHPPPAQQGGEQREARIPGAASGAGHCPPGRSLGRAAGTRPVRLRRPRPVSPQRDPGGARAAGS